MEWASDNSASKSFYWEHQANPINLGSVSGGSGGVGVPCSISELYPESANTNMNMNMNMANPDEQFGASNHKLLALMESVVDISKKTQQLISSSPIASDSRIPGITKMIKSENKIGAPRGTYILMLVMRKLETILSIQDNCLLAKSDPNVAKLNKEIIDFLNDTIGRMKKEFPSVLKPAHGKILAKNKPTKKTYKSVIKRQAKTKGS